MKTKRGSLNLGYVVAVFGGIGVSAFFALPLLEQKNSAGLLVFLLGPLLSVVAYGVLRKSQRRAVAPAGSQNRLALAGAAFVVGPVLAGVGAAICVYLSDVHPLDRGPYIGVATFIGFIAGTIVAVALAASAPFK